LGVFASYAYRIKTSEKGRLALGLQAGFSQYAADLQSVALGSTPSFDPAFAENVSQMMPNVGGGIWYNNDRFYAGFSVPHIINNALSKDYQFLNDSDGARQYRHYFVTAGYVFDLNAALKLKPSFLVKVVEGAPMQMDLNANLWMYEKVGLGLSYRSGDSIDALLEFQLSHQFKLGYAYDYTLTELRRYNSGSHEIMLRYQFSVNRSKIITPRFF
jgi:type IX secretion system PorP/SprF family membrane protein